jgi:hypothetical protein
MAIVYVMATLTLLMAFASLGVDLARVQVAKTELRRTADAAARAAASAMSGGVSSAEAAAVAIATANQVDGAAASLVTGSDVEFGTWSTASRTFTALTGANRSNANAVRVTVRRTTARGNAIPLVFAPAIGRSSCDVTASSIASASATPMQYVGLNSFNAKNNVYGGTYNSSTDTQPTEPEYSNGAILGSNGPITAKNNTNIPRVMLGPSGSSTLDCDNEPLMLPTNIAVSMPTWSTVGTAANISGNVTYGPGTHYVSDLTLAHNASLSFSGPATVYVSGSVVFSKDGAITAYNNRPENLKIYQKGTGTFGASNANNVEITADIMAPEAAFTAKNNATFKGRAVFGTIDVKNNLSLFYDESLTPLFPPGSTGVATVK